MQARSAGVTADPVCMMLTTRFAIPAIAPMAM